MKEDKITYEVKQEEPKFSRVPGLDEELIATGIYLKTKVISLAVTATGNYEVKCGFPPKIVQATVQDSTQSSNGSTDFTTIFSIRIFDSAGVATSESSNLVNLSTLTGNITKRYYNGFNMNISSFSGGTKTIYFTCYS